MKKFLSLIFTAVISVSVFAQSPMYDDYKDNGLSLKSEPNNQIQRRNEYMEIVSLMKEKFAKTSPYILVYKPGFSVVKTNYGSNTVDIGVDVYLVKDLEKRRIYNAVCQSLVNEKDWKKWGIEELLRDAYPYCPYMMAELKTSDGAVVDRKRRAFQIYEEKIYTSTLENTKTHAKTYAALSDGQFFYAGNQFVFTVPADMDMSKLNMSFYFLDDEYQFDKYIEYQKKVDRIRQKFGGDPELIKELGTPIIPFEVKNPVTLDDYVNKVFPESFRKEKVTKNMYVVTLPYPHSGLTRGLFEFMRDVAGTSLDNVCRKFYPASTIKVRFQHSDILKVNLNISEQEKQSLIYLLHEYTPVYGRMPSENYIFEVYPLHYVE